MVDFELRPGACHLLLGQPAAGKSAVLEVLANLRRLLVEGVVVGEAFPPFTHSRWGEGGQRLFELDVETEGFRHAYQLVFASNTNFSTGASISWIQCERLMVDGRPEYSYEWDGTQSGRQWASGLAPLLERPSTVLAPFARWSWSLTVLNDSTLSRFPSWLSPMHRSDDPIFLDRMLVSILGAEGFQCFGYTDSDDVVFVFWRYPEGARLSRRFMYRFAELAPLHKAVIATCATLYMGDGPGTLLAVDQFDPRFSPAVALGGLLTLRKRIYSQYLLVSRPLTEDEGNALPSPTCTHLARDGAIGPTLVQPLAALPRRGNYLTGTDMEARVRSVATRQFAATIRRAHDELRELAAPERFFPVEVIGSRKNLFFLVEGALRSLCQFTSHKSYWDEVPPEWRPRLMAAGSTIDALYHSFVKWDIEGNLPPDVPALARKCLAELELESSPPLI
ncbi:hypothetical protein DAT35_55080 [Vitiosangium sp. GDMCC 1.1324]|nr:hypothetical protein DAT35_55080 [Vitiosangium sp. GDMCC 1.1324]